MWDKVRIKGHTIIPLRVYLSHGKAKIEIAVAKGKKLHDKRESMKKADSQREISRAMRRR